MVEVTPGPAMTTVTVESDPTLTTGPDPEDPLPDPLPELDPVLVVPVLLPVLLPVLVTPVLLPTFPELPDERFAPLSDDPLLHPT